MDSELDQLNSQWGGPLCPNDIEVLLHCHTTPGPHPRMHAPAVAEAINALLRHKLIAPADREDPYYVTTRRGAAFIEALCNTKLPVAVWVQP